MIINIKFTIIKRMVSNNKIKLELNKKFDSDSDGVPLKMSCNRIKKY
jgi:hypothetical protein